MNIINATPHELKLITQDNNVVTIPPSGLLARVTTTPVYTHTENGVDFYTTQTGEPAWTYNNVPCPPPAPYPNDVYVVSGIFRQHCPRDDFYQPAELLRDTDGKVIGAKGLSK